MVIFIILASVFVFYLVSGLIVAIMASHLLRNYGIPPRNFVFNTLEILKDLRDLKHLTNDPHVPEDVVARAKFYYGYLTWGFGIVIVFFFVVFFLSLVFGWPK